MLKFILRMHNATHTSECTSLPALKCSNAHMRSCGAVVLWYNQKERLRKLMTEMQSVCIDQSTPHPSVASNAKSNVICECQMVKCQMVKWSNAKWSNGQMVKCQVPSAKCQMPNSKCTASGMPMPMPMPMPIEMWYVVVVGVVVVVEQTL